MATFILQLSNKLQQQQGAGEMGGGCKTTARRQLPPGHLCSHFLAPGSTVVCKGAEAKILPAFLSLEKAPAATAPAQHRGEAAVC